MPSLTPPILDDPARRRFLQLMGASLALAGGACSGPPPEEIVSYVDLPPELARSPSLFYATAHLHNGYAQGVLVETSMGRATKVEGNALHPGSLGATSVQAQASVLQLWDPERSQTVVHDGQIATWNAFDAALAQCGRQLSASRGGGFRILSGTTSSPTLIAQMRELLARYPEARWHVHDPHHAPTAVEGARRAFGRVLDCTYAFDAAAVVVTLDADFLSGQPGSIRYARDLMSRRADPGVRMSRVYAIECTPGLIGAVADERLPLPPAETERTIWRVAALLDLAPRGLFQENAATKAWERALAEALRAHRGESLVIAGRELSAETHALVHRINAGLGNVGRTVRYIEPVAAQSEGGDNSVDALAVDMHAGRVETLVMLGTNPVYDAPADLQFATALKRVALSIHCGLYRDETARLSAWHAPQPHVYEQWSDARAFDGTATIVQPVMRPRFAVRSHLEIVGQLASASVLPLERVRRTWVGGEQADSPRSRWRDTLRTGIVAGSAHPAVSASVREALSPPRLNDAPLVAVFNHDPFLGDSDLANNAWLQELPRPLTKLTWDNALLIAPATARALGIAEGDVVRVESEGRTIEAPAWIAPGHGEGAVTLPLGYGRSAAGTVGNAVGFDAHPLRTRMRSPLPVTLAKVGRRHAFATTQNHARMEGRDLARHASLREFLANPRFANDEPKERVPRESLYPPYAYPDYAWGMAIDLNACIGCSACTIACQAENNIAVVGKEQVALGREMHWIRVDRYYEGPIERPLTLFQPVPCMHCENAPCEEVCPVGATVHDSEGLNVQVYNRCVGTRFCSQNCPYKVRRFNFLQFSDDKNPGLKGVRNPEVTVRQRGVMEKCTYCIQRITRGRIEAEKAGRKLRDGEVVTACQAVCPTRAITFGDLNDAGSAVRRMKAGERSYTLLAELNTRPRTTYLARIANRDPQVTNS